MQPSKDGHRNVEFGTVNEVHVLIDAILDAKQFKQSDGHLQALKPKPSGEPNH